MFATRAGEDKVLVMVSFNSAYEDMFFNAICRLQQLNMRNWVALAMDTSAWNTCMERGLPCFPVEGLKGGADTVAVEYASRSFNYLCKRRPKAVLYALRLGYDVLFMDVDVFLKRNPLPKVRAPPEMVVERRALNGLSLFIVMQLQADCGNASMCMQSDSLATSKLDIDPAHHGTLCAGFYLARSRSQTIRLFERILAAFDHDARNKRDDQKLFVDLLCGLKGRWARGSNDCINPELDVHTRALPRSIYMNGQVHMAAGDRITRISKDSVVSVHFNFRVGHHTKVRDMRKASMWVVSEEGRCHCKGLSKPVSLDV
jgi:hypothetical protein